MEPESTDAADWNLAYVPNEKVRDYLLGDGSQAARGEAKFFADLGFQRAEWPHLREALLGHLQQGEPRLSRRDENGVTFAVTAPIATLVGRVVWITSHWIVRPGDPRPQFTSAKPDRPLAPPAHSV